MIINICQTELFVEKSRVYEVSSPCHHGPSHFLSFFSQHKQLNQFSKLGEERDESTHTHRRMCGLLMSNTCGDGGGSRHFPRVIPDRLSNRTIVMNSERRLSSFSLSLYNGARWSDRPQSIKVSRCSRKNETYPPSSAHAKLDNERSLKRFSLAVNCVDYVHRGSR